MSTHETVHATFTLERSYPVEPARVFAAWADPPTKARWFAGGASNDHQLDFRVGGREINHGGPDGRLLTFESIYHDIVPDQRIVFSSTMSVEGHGVTTVSTTTVLMIAESAGTRLVLTQQGTYLDGHEDPSWREHGTAGQLDALGVEFA